MRDFFDAIDRYQGYRDETFVYVMDALESRINQNQAWERLRSLAVQMTAIDETVLHAYQHLPPSRFPWGELRDQFRPYIDRFEVAIWCNGRLQALSYGRPSKGDHNVTIHFVERVGGESSPLKGFVIPIVADIATTYAAVLGKRYVRVKDPDPAAIASYMRVGFTEAKRIGQTAYLERRVEL